MMICVPTLPPNRITTGGSRLQHSIPSWLEHVLSSYPLEHIGTHWNTLEHVLSSYTNSSKALSSQVPRSDPQVSRGTWLGSVSSHFEHVPDSWGEWSYLPSGTRTYVIKWDTIRDKSKSWDPWCIVFFPHIDFIQIILNYLRYNAYDLCVSILSQ